MITISLAQIDIAFGDRDANLAQANGLVQEAAARGSDLIVFPELWTSGYDLERAAELAEPLDGYTAHVLSGWAMAYKLWITGSFLLRTENGICNAAPLFGPEGQVLGPYCKIHRFRLMAEDRWLEAGATPGLYERPWGTTGIGICYDLRFPELFRTYALAGARLILLPSEWPHPRLAHWRTLVRARAIENQCFVAAVNRVGSDRANAFCGHSVLVGPWGETIVESGDAPLLTTETIDLDQSDDARSRMPVLADRRPECYTLSSPTT